MAKSNITLTAEARDALRELRNETCGYGRKLPRLAEHEMVTLALEEPDVDDTLLEDGGIALLAVSRHVLDQICEGARLDVTRSDTGEPQFKIVHEA